MNRRFRAALASAATIAVLVVGALVSPAAIAAPTSSAAEDPEFDPITPYFLINAGTSLAADLPAGSTDEQSPLRQTAVVWKSNKAWYPRPAGNGVFTLTAESAGLALERLPTGDRGIVVGQRSITGQANQQWVLTPVGDDQYAIRAADSDQVLQVGAVAGDPAAVTVGADDGKQTQRWRLDPKYALLVFTNSWVAAGATGWYNAPVDIDFGMAYRVQVGPNPTLQWRVAGTDDWSSDWRPRITAEGSTVIEYHALRSGFVAAGSTDSTVIRIDSVAPTASATTTPASGTVAAGGTVSAAFTAADATSGVDHTEYSVDGGATWVRGAEASFTDAGTHAVAYRAVDVAGNVGTANTVNLTVQAPVATATATPTVTSADPEPTADGWYQEDVTVALAAPKAGQKIQYRLYGSDWKNYTGPVEVARNGVATLDHRLIAGGQPVAGSQASLTVKLDKVVPTVTATRTPSSGNGTPSTPVSVSFVPKDLHSGVGAVEYRVNSGAWATASAPVVFDKIGSYTVQYRVTDVAGNVSAVRSVPVTITAK